MDSDDMSSNKTSRRNTGQGEGHDNGHSLLLLGSQFNLRQDQSHETEESEVTRNKRWCQLLMQRPQNASKAELKAWLADVLEASDPMESLEVPPQNG